jgi:hypothetical protein
MPVAAGGGAGVALGRGGHGGAHSAAALELFEIAAAVVADGDALVGGEAGGVRQAAVVGPAHGAAVAEEADLGVGVDVVAAAALFDRAGAVGERFAAGLPGGDIGLGEDELEHQGADATFDAAGAFADELQRRDVIELIAVGADDPVAGAEAMADAVEVDAADAAVVEEGLLLSVDACVAGEVLDDVPGVVGAAGIEDGEGVGPGEEVGDGLGEDVAFIAGDEDGVEGGQGGSKGPNGKFGMDAANSEQRTANSEQRTANSEQRTANSEQRGF